MKSLLCRVSGPNFTAAIWFEKHGERWVIRDMAPILRKILGARPQIKRIPEKLRAKGLTWVWLKPKEEEKS